MYPEFHQQMNRIFILCVLFLLMPKAKGQDDAIKVDMIKGVTKDFLWEYVSYSEARKITKAIKLKFDTLGYPNWYNNAEFAYALTLDLRKMTNDYHISVYPPLEDSIQFLEDKKNPYIRLKRSKNIRKSDIRRYKNYNKEPVREMLEYGEISIRPGNIGYVEVFGFMRAYGKPKDHKDRIKWKDVMRFFRKTESIIIDFRGNPGGSLSVSAYFTSFFVHKPNKNYVITQEKFVPDTIPNGKTTIVTEKVKYPMENNSRFTNDKHIYLLIGEHTFSAAGLVAYQLQKAGACTIIGEPCNGPGNAHHGELLRNTYHVLVPTILVFDGENDTQCLFSTVIMPDIEISADTAMEYTLDLIRTKENYSASLDTVTLYYKDHHGEEKPIYPDSLVEHLSEYEGDYQKIKIEQIQNLLYVEYDQSYRQVLAYLEKDEFEFEDDIKLRFLRDKKGKIRAVEVIFTSIQKELFRKV